MTSKTKVVVPLFATYLSMTVIDEDTSILNHNKHEFRLASENSKISKDGRILKKYPKVEKILLNKFKEFAKDVLSYDNEFAISTSWFTKVEKGQYSEYHRHKNSFYSGVYYYDEYDNNSACIEFDSPIQGLFDFCLMPTELGLQNSPNWSIPPQKNTLLLFPSYLQHRIGTHKVDSSRYSLAFNIVPIGQYGQGDSTYNTSWFSSRGFASK